MRKMGKADLHIHSTASDGVRTPAAILDYVEHHTDLDLVAIADHDVLAGSLEAREIAGRRRFRFEVLVAVEVTTLEGHLLAYDIERPIRMLQPLARTVRLIHEQGGFAVAPHPLSPLTRSIGRRGLLRNLSHPDPSARLDGIEVLNPSVAGRVVYQKIVRLNRTLGLRETGGSDSHTLETIGSAFTRFVGRSADDYRRSFWRRMTTAEGVFWGWTEHRHLLRIAGPQSFRALVLLPARHIRRAFTK